MSTAPPARHLSRAGHPAAPVRLLHLGLGGFFRAHQAWYTAHAPDADRWGIAGFTGSSTDTARRLTAQDGLYHLVTRAADGDRFEVVGSLAAAHPGGDHAAWLAYWRRPELAAVTLTVTEAGYGRDTAGRLDIDRPALRADIAALRADPGALVATAPARLLAGLAARRRAGAGPVAIVPCDNLPGNGAATAGVIRELADAVGTERLRAAAGHASYVTSVVDRITPYPTDEDARTVRRATGWDDSAPVVTEPFSEWVLSGDFPAGRPRWEDAGARFVADTTPHEERKLWLLNGGHSLLAYAGPLRGHTTVAEAVADPVCRGWLDRWWAEASNQLALPAADLTAYRTALTDRFANPRIHHTLAKIAEDGSRKLPVRVLPTLRAERKQGTLPDGAIRVVAAWLLHLRGLGAPVRDAAAPDAAGPLPTAAAGVVAALDPALARDRELIDAVASRAQELAP
ncbi:mannitol dehydrogenase family protein [Yinghuangia sp. ASG 101]|uniref:mannitol dehydrogenase family protein n=1 Tax=Yinghuangia sp. ASG 101 TaxID=2896848 RepID=UPI001E417121|nr:mannitol dehydrogenase family protein [Yinghuangia sp. ASG 101]UGQ13248.1 mannitol dehydrogenase family protein [Yinghuangia sp. ASG 101]